MVILIISIFKKLVQNRKENNMCKVYYGNIILGECDTYDEAEQFVNDYIRQYYDDTPTRFDEYVIVEE